MFVDCNELDQFFPKLCFICVLRYALCLMLHRVSHANYAPWPTLRSNSTPLCPSSIPCNDLTMTHTTLLLYPTLRPTSVFHATLCPILRPRSDPRYASTVSHAMTALYSRVLSLRRVVSNPPPQARRELDESTLLHATAQLRREDYFLRH